MRNRSTALTAHLAPNLHPHTDLQRIAAHAKSDALRKIRDLNIFCEN
jgi:hypothetical protein